MSRLEDALREALKREDPGPEFTLRALERAASAQPRGAGWRSWVAAAFRPPALRWVAAAALTCTLVIFSGLEYRRERRVRAEGEQAKQQLVLALRIAGNKLQMAQAKIMHRRGE